MAPIKLTTVVQPGGRIEVSSPELPVGHPVDVTIQPAEPRLNGRRSILDILADCPGHLLFKTADEVDAYLSAERDTWDH